MKTIWIVNYYAGTPETMGNVRHFEFARHLIAAGYIVRVFRADHSGDAIEFKGKKYINKDYGGVPYTCIKAKSYVGNGIKRILSIFQFAWRLFLFRNKFEKPDIILQNIHAPFDFPVVWAAKRLKSRYIAEAWDLWPNSFVRFGLISAKSLMVKFAYGVEKKMYENASDIIFTFEGGIDYLRWHKWTTETRGKIDPQKVHYINNGILLKEFYDNARQYLTDDPDLNRKDKFKIIYLGSIRLVNDVKQLIDAARVLKDDDRFSFLIYGNGNDKPVLQKYVRENHIDNVIFKNDRIPYHYVPYVVSQASLNVMNYRKGFGIYGASSGKMFQYLAAGKPIVCNIKLNYSDIERHNLGVAADLDAPEKYANVIRGIANLPEEEYEAMCARNKEIAKEFDYDVLSKKLLEVIER